MGIFFYTAANDVWSIDFKGWWKSDGKICEPFTVRDMTKKELNDIFDQVYGIDKTFKGYFSDVNERIKTYNEKMKYLYGVIQPNFSICSAGTISAETSLFNAQLKAADGKINGNFENELDWAAKEAALEATKGIVGSALKAVVDVVTLPVSMILPLRSTT